MSKIIGSRDRALKRKIPQPKPLVHKGFDLVDDDSVLDILSILK